MKAAGRQTDAMIEHMRDEQRPWLSIETPSMGYLSEEKTWAFSFNVFNHGKRPGTILVHYFEIVLAGLDELAIPASGRKSKKPTRIHRQLPS